MGYEYIEDIAIADAAFSAWGDTLEEVFIQAARATMNVMVEALASIEPRTIRRVVVQGDSTDLLLFDFLGEVIFYKDAEQLLLLPEKVKIESREGALELTARMVGERLEPGRHSLLTDVKAVTMHRFALARDGSVWRAQVVLDL